jgi:hypothetical protein
MTVAEEIAHESRPEVTGKVDSIASLPAEARTNTTFVVSMAGP